MSLVERPLNERIPYLLWNSHNRLRSLFMLFSLVSSALVKEGKLIRYCAHCREELSPPWPYVYDGHIFCDMQCALSFTAIKQERKRESKMEVDNFLTSLWPGAKDDEL